MGELRDQIEARFVTDALPTLLSYLRIPCLSPAFDVNWSSNGHIDRAADLLLEWARNRRIPGLDVKVLRLEGRTPALVATLEGRGGRRVYVSGGGGGSII